MGGKLGDPDFAIKAYAFIQEIIPSKVICIPGLSRRNIKNNRATFGAAAGMTIREALLHFGDHKVSADIFLTNDPDLFLLPPELVLKEYIGLVRQLYQDTDFEVLFMTTVFGLRRELGSAKALGRSEFNRFLVDHISDPEYRVDIRSRAGVSHQLMIKVVDMTNIVPIHDLKSREYFCKDNNDGTHLNAKYVEIYLRKLASQVTDHVRETMPSPQPPPTSSTKRVYKPRPPNTQLSFARLTRLLGLIDISD